VTINQTTLINLLITIFVGDRMRYLTLLFIVPLSGCSAIREIMDNSEAIVGGVLGSVHDSQFPEKIVTAVTAPSAISITEAVLASIAVLTGGVAGYVGVKKGKKAKKK